MSTAHPEWSDTVNFNLIDHERRIAELEEKVTPFYEALKMYPEPYPERNDKRVSALEAQVNRNNDRLEYIELLLHRYINAENNEKLDEIEALIRQRSSNALADFDATALSTLHEAIGLIEELVYMTCTKSDTGLDIVFDSMTIDTYNHALRFLAGCGKVIIEKEEGRRIVAVPTWAKETE